MAIKVRNQSIQKEEEPLESQETGNRPSHQNKKIKKGVSAIPVNVEELKVLLGDQFHAKNQDEQNWLLKWLQELVEKKGEDWIKKNRIGLLRQWEYIRDLL